MSTDPRTDPDDGGTPTAAVDDDRGGGAKRSRRRLSVLAVAAAVLVAGGGGAYWASTTGGETDTTPRDDGPPPLALDGFTAERAGDQDISGGPRTAAYRTAAPLPDDGPRRAPVYRATGSGPDRQTVAELAKALDVPGEVRREGAQWRVGGEDDGDGPILVVGTGPTATWRFTGTGSWDVRVPELSGDGSAEPPSSDGADTAAVAGHGKPVSRESAERTARPVLEAAGFEKAVAEASETDRGLRFVRFVPQLGQHPAADLPTTLAVDGEGQPVFGKGRLVSVAKGPDYPVLSAEETLAQLNRRPARPGMAPCPAKPGEKDTAEDTAAVEHRDGKGSGGGPRLLPCATDDRPATARVTDATFHLARYTSGEKQLLVPSWRFTLDAPSATRDGRRTVSHPAVEPRYLGGGKAPEGGQSTRLPDGSSGRLDTAGVEIQHYQAKDRTLTIHFWGGVCATYTATAEESDKAVKVRIEGKRKEGQCIAVAERQSVKVTLDKPVGDRKVTDERGERLPRRPADS